jgi:signal transduction histidine kinase
MNLVTNAIKYGAGRPIEITVELADGQALLRVRDHGIGIAHEDMPFLFDRFRRAGDRNERAGFGLGLWIVHRVLDKLGGTIAVDSAAGDGSTFTIALPLGAERAEVARAA